MSMSVNVIKEILLSNAPPKLPNRMSIIDSGVPPILLVDELSITICGLRKQAVRVLKLMPIETRYQAFSQSLINSSSSAQQHL